MSRFEYNFTRQSQFEELKDRNKELQQQNQLLKESLQELIKVNTELTESIEELNNNPNYNQNHQDIEKRFQMLFNQNHTLREQLEQEQEKAQQLREGAISNDQTESLVNVLEELIESFKNIEEKYQEEIKELQQQVGQSKGNWEEAYKKTLGDMEGKFNTVEALSQQIRRKDDMMEGIMARVARLQKQGVRGEGTDGAKVRSLEEEIERLRREGQEKEQVLGVYRQLLSSIRSKLLEKF